MSETTTFHQHTVGVKVHVCSCPYSTCGWVCEGEACFGLSQLVKVVQADHVGRLKMALWVLVALAAAPDFVVKL